MTAAAPGLTLEDLNGILVRTDPSALLVPPRILRRVIKQDRGLGGLGMQVPHYKSYVIGRDALLHIADRRELGVQPQRELPGTLILLPQPDEKRLRTRSPESILRLCWRFLFHARVHVAFEARKLDQAAIVERVRRLGSAVFNEAHAVLLQENFLLPAYPSLTASEEIARVDEACAVYEEFAALYLELRYFARNLLPRYFPAIVDFDTIDCLLAEDVDTETLFARTRPEGARLPGVKRDNHVSSGAVRTQDVPASSDSHARSAPEADIAAAKGNDVRAARLQFRAGNRPAVVEAIRRLCDRLQKELHFPASETTQWRAGLEILVEPAAGGLWPVEARLLYDLQEVCFDQEKDIYALDLVEWAVTWGQRPIKRLLPHQPFVFAVKNLRRALNHLTAARMPDADRHLLHELLVHALHDAETRLRERFRPLIHAALDDVDLRPSNYPEQVARATVAEEMLDRILDRGFLTMGDLRDALARNRLKLPDVANPAEIILGDRLLRANRRLAVALDGVYRRGEIYMRWLQRLSSVFFGNAIGRFLVLFLILPIGGACVAVKGPQLAREEVQHLTRRLARLAGSESASPHHRAGHHSGLQFDESDILPLVAASLFLLGLLHSAWFRRVVWKGLRALGRVLRLLFHDLPTAILRLPLIRWFLQSRTYQALYSYFLKPLSWAALTAFVLYLVGTDAGVSAATGGVAFLAALVLLNSRLGLRAEEACTDALVRVWYLVQNDLLPGLFRRVMDFFKWLLESLDRIIYTFDEWLRFRTGDSKLSFAVKPVLGLTWFALTYVIRFVINLFVEPTLNPIKHFPVVTVAAKLLVPLIPVLSPALLGVLEPLVGKAGGHVIVVLVIILMPGIAGFLVWELKENWKLYRANQPDELLPVTVGSHGETMLRLLRPGFHSGTLPKLYARLRRYERGRHAPKARKRREELHHVEEVVRHFAERNLVAILKDSLGWRRTPFVGAVHAATNQLRIELACTSLEGPESMEIAFEEQAGHLVAGVSRSGWLEHLTQDERLILADALAGFYKLAGVDLVREQVATLLPRGAAWSMEDGGLIVWQSGLVTEYRLSDEAALPWERLLFDRTPLRWTDWLQTWQRDQDGKGHEPPLLPELRFLP